MIRCANCGRQNPSGVDVCHHCGKALADGSNRQVPVPAADLGADRLAAKRKTQVESGDAGDPAAEKRRTEFEAPGGGGAAPGWHGPSASGDPGGGKRKTVMTGPVFVAGAEPGRGAGWGARGAGGGVFVEPAGAPQPAGRPDTGRRIMGWLVTFAHNHDGLAFEIREGRNRLGRSDEADIAIPEDRKVSGEHAMILCRSGRFQVFDERSVNGTFLNEEEIFPSEPRDLHDGDVLRCGDTAFIAKLLDLNKVKELWPKPKEGDGR